MVLSLQNTSYGTVVISDKIVATTSPQNFSYQQNQVDTFESTVVSGKSLSISMRIKALNNEAKKKYGYDEPGDFQVFNEPFATSYQVTAANLRAAIAAAFPTLSVTEGGGVITISTNGNYGLMIEYEFTRYLTHVEVTRAVDLTTQTGDATLTGTVDGGAIRYSEAPVTGVTPTQTEGELVNDGGFFRIVGKNNIMNAKFIQETATAAVNYQIYA